MVNQNDILAALQGGADPEAIAQNFANMLNAAMAEKAKQEEAALQAAAEATAKKKIDRMAEILAALDAFVKEFYPDIYDEEMGAQTDAARLVEVIDQAYEELKRMQPLLDSLQDLLHKLEVDPEVKNKAAAPVDPIAAFLKMHNL